MKRISVHIFFLGMLLLFSCNSQQDTNLKHSPSSEKVTTVKVINPTKNSFSSELEIVGRTFPNKRILLRAMESGEVVQLRRDIGDFVHKGDTLAILYNPIISRSLERDKAIMDVAMSTYNRLKNVFTQTPHLTTVQSYENAQGDYLIAKSNYEASLNRSDLLNIISPFSGFITKRFVDPGEVVQNSLINPNAKNIFELTDKEIIRLVVSLPETEVSNIDIGSEASVIFPELNQFSLNVNVSRISRSLDLYSKTMEVQFDIPNSNGVLLPGMYAVVSMSLNSRSQVLSLPIEVLTAKNGSYFVLSVEDGKVRKIPIRKGISNTKFFEVLNDEITEFSQIIIEGKSMVSIDSPVNVIQ